MLMSENEFFDTLQDFEIVDFSSDNYESIDLDDYLGGFIRWINPPSKKTNWLIKEYHSTCILMNIQLNTHTNQVCLLLKFPKTGKLISMDSNKKDRVIYFKPNKKQRIRRMFANLIVNKVD